MIEVKYTDEDGNSLDSPQTIIDPTIIESVLAVPAGSGERSHHVDACRIWLNGGTPITHQYTADAVGKPLSTIRTWARKYRWGDRFKAIDKMAKADIATMAAIDVDREMRHMLASVDKAMGSYNKSVDAGDIKWKGSDIKGLVETKMLLIGKPTERHEHLGANPVVDGILHDPESISIATALFVRIGLGKGDASGSG